MASRTRVSVSGDRFVVNGSPTYPGRWYRGCRIEGLLLNARMVQGIYDDGNPETVGRWAYPDTGRWDPERNTDEFVSAMPEWRRHGLAAFTINLQGGSPEGYSKAQPWLNSAFGANGALKPSYLRRLSRILDRADELGLVVILGLFYFGQDEHLADEAAVCRGVDEAVDWVLDAGYEHVILEINNECDVPRYEHEILQPQRVHELIARARGMSKDGRRLLVGTSFRGGAIPTPSVAEASDLVLIHGNGVSDPDRIAAQVAEVRLLSGSREMPIVFNEDDHFDFDQSKNNMLMAIASGASWGYYDPGPGFGGREARGDYVDGYQNVPVNWGINTERKRGFFNLLKQVTGA